MRHNLPAKSGARSQGGFSLIELLIVVAIVGVLASIAVIGGKAVMSGTKESVVGSKLREVGEAQMQYRVGNGRGRYGTLAELQAATTPAGTPVLSPQLLNSQGWLIREPAGAPTGDALRSAFSVEAVPAPGNSSTNAYCINQTGVLRRQTGGAACTAASPAVPND
jgi:prepilin-type N-terminal cleavage/methylation domain-containing protein